MKKTAILIALLIAPLSGCLGIPEGAIDHGSTVQAVVTARDAETGDILVSSQRVEFVPGSGNSGLGFEFERQLLGRAGDYVGTITVRGDPSTQWGGSVETQATYTSPLVQQVPMDQFTASFGNPTVGQRFAPQFSFFEYEVVSFNEVSLSYKAIPEQGQRDPLPHVGAFLVTSVQGDELVQVLEPDVGAVFRILPPSPFNPTTPLGLEPGSYRTVGHDGEHILYEHSDATNPDIVGHDLDVHVRILGVRASPTPVTAEPVNGNYGVRQSAYINGAPSAVKDFGPLSGMPAADDHGHDH